MSRNNSSFDEVFEMMLTEAAIQADENIGAKLQNPEGNIIFSEEHEQKMRKLFRHEQHKLFKKKLVRYSKRCACIILLISVIASMTIFSVNAWRVRFLDFVMKSGEPNTDYNFYDGEAYSYSDGAVGLKYIPDGFAIVENIRDGEHIFLEFKNQEQYFSLKIEGAGGISNVDTEEGFVEELTSNGKNAIFVDRRNVRFLVWGDERRYYTLYGNIGKNELIKIAENVLIGQK